ncbi:MAG TPA: hypothetical protein VEL03_18795 [Streptosporangiaceae bacterium]|nr:hypothetical protein [Streptosporangiaceae bacterium]
MTDSDSVRLTPLTRPDQTQPEQQQPDRAEQSDGSDPLVVIGYQPDRAAAPRTRVPGWVAAACIGVSLAIMVAAEVVRQDWQYPPLRLPAGGFPFDATSVHVSIKVVAVALWLACLLGAAGVLAGLVAARRGARPPMRLILILAGVVIGVLAVLPPGGSTDVLDYAAYGRLLLLGHNPYVVPPFFLHVTDQGFGSQVPWRWQFQVSLYGPVATFEQYAAARVGGDSASRVVFWLKLWNALGFALVAYVADRMLRSDPARRLRAHLLWTLNPLLVWGLVAAGHLDVLAAAAGLLGLLAVGPWSPTARPTVGRALAAGALVGVAADIKINYIAFGVGLAWALRRRPAAILAAGIGGLAVLAPTYAWFGSPAVSALFARRNKSTVDSFYRLTDLNAYYPYLGEVAVILAIGMALLLLARLPAGDPLRPALRPALALSVAWLVMWPYQLPWYDAMAFCLLVLYPASRLDWLLMIRLTAATLANTPGNPLPPPGPVLGKLDQLTVHTLAPGVLLACAIGLVVLCLTGYWRADPPGTLAGLTGQARAAPLAAGDLT